MSDILDDVLLELEAVDASNEAYYAWNVNDLPTSMTHHVVRGTRGSIDALRDLLAKQLIIHTHCPHPVERVAAISAKCSDRCCTSVGDQEYTDGYVPSSMGVGGGDYVAFRWCLDCGAIVGDEEGWPKNPQEDDL